MIFGKEPQNFPVFVYGTLRRGDSRFHHPHLLEVLHEEAYLEDFKMLDLGAFPGIVPGKGVVRGEIHLFSSLDDLDRIEGYRERDPDSSLYIRRLVEVQLPTSDNYEAWTYTFNLKGNRLGQRELRVVEGGDWLAHRGLYQRESR